jgi:1-acyl-sn-glycerol-3-phosphate acyltransferase
MKKLIYEFIFFKLMGWKITGHMDDAIKKSVLMILPHTSWHDFYIGLLARGIIGMEMHYVAKKELFQFPFKWYFRWMGGAPLDRTGNLNKVDAIVEMFNKRKVFRMAIAPEGTRKKVNELKTGFYYIALKANVPIIPVAFDYCRKEVRLGQPYYPTANIDRDLKILSKHFIGVKGRTAENGLDISVLQ